MGVLAHLDLDAFFAAVELHRRPDLRGRPVVVGGDPDGRGVVATASYAARRFGIRSAMSSAEARRRCPNVVFVPPDMAEYRAWSQRVWACVRALSDRVEQVGIDEGYLALDERGGEHAREVQQALRSRVRLSASLGVATCKVVAKIASDRDKPGGLTIVPAGEEASFLAPLPLRALPGIGPRTQARLNAAGLTIIGELADLDDDRLSTIMPGQVGAELRERARGVDPRPIAAAPAERLSISLERTFERDIGTTDELVALLDAWAVELAERLRRGGHGARTVTVKLRFPNFDTRTRAQTLSGATNDARVIAAVAVELLHRVLAERPEPVRLLGLGVAGLADHAQLTLFPAATRVAGLYETHQDVYTCAQE